MSHCEYILSDPVPLTFRKMSNKSYSFFINVYLRLDRQSVKKGFVYEKNKVPLISPEKKVSYIPLISPEKKVSYILCVIVMYGLLSNAVTTFCYHSYLDILIVSESKLSQTIFNEFTIG